MQLGLGSLIPAHRQGDTPPKLSDEDLVSVPVRASGGDSALLGPTGDDSGPYERAVTFDDVEAGEPARRRDGEAQ